MSYRNAVAYVLAALSVALSLVANVAFAANDTADIWLTKTFGVWRQPPRYGYYQVVVYRQGIEHPTDKVVVNILEADDKIQQKKLIKSVALESPDVKGYVQDIQLKMLDTQRMAISLDVAMKAMEGIVEREIYIFLPDGKYKTLVKAEQFDIFE